MNRVPKVRRGQGIAFRAAHWNSFADAANAHAERQLAGAAGRAVTHWREGAVVSVRNDTGADRDRFAILGTHEPVFSPSEDEGAFTRSVVLKGGTPDEDYHVGRFVVLQEALPAGKIGRGMIAGVTAVKLNVEAEGEDRFADICDGVTGYLTAGASGSAYVLWRAGGTGEQWAYVLLGTPNWFHTGGSEYQVWQLQDIGGGALRPKWDYVRMHE